MTTTLTEDQFNTFMAAFYACEAGFTSSLRAGLKAVLAAPTAPVGAETVAPDQSKACTCLGVEPALCPHCDGTGDSVVMSDGGPDAYDMTLNCPHCKGGGTLADAYSGVCDLLKRSENNYREAAAILYFGGADPSASKRLAALAEYVMQPNMQAEWLRDRLLGLANIAAQAPSTEPASGPKCRDCADFGPICPNSGKPCAPPAAAVTEVSARRAVEVEAMNVADRDGRFLNAQGHQQAIDAIDFCVSALAAHPAAGAVHGLTEDKRRAQAFGEYLKDCDKHAIQTETASAFLWGWRAATAPALPASSTPEGEGDKL